MRKVLVALAIVLLPSYAVAQEGPEADVLVRCLYDSGVALLDAGRDLDAAYAGSWAACDKEASVVPVEYDHVDFDGLEGIDEVAYHALLDTYEDRQATEVAAAAIRRADAQAETARRQAVQHPVTTTLPANLPPAF